METVKRKEGQYRFKEHAPGIKVVILEETGEYLVLDDGFVYAAFNTVKIAEEAAKLLRVEADISEGLDEALAAAASGVFKVSMGLTGVALPRAKMAELLNASCGSLIQQYVGDAEQERNK